MKCFLDELHQIEKAPAKRHREKVEQEEPTNRTTPAETPPEKKTRRSKRVVSPDNVDYIMSQSTNNITWTKKKLFDSMTRLIGTESFVHSILLCDGSLNIGSEAYTKAAEIYALYNKQGFTGSPPQGSGAWSKQALCEALDKIQKEGEKTVLMNSFKMAVVKKGKSEYKTAAGITKMYNNWKKGGRQSLNGMGRPPAASSNEVRKGVDELVQTDGLGGTNAISHISM